MHTIYTSYLMLAPCNGAFVFCESDGVVCCSSGLLLLLAVAAQQDLTRVCICSNLTRNSAQGENQLASSLNCKVTSMHNLSYHDAAKACLLPEHGQSLSTTM